jgi:hypothetical protein
MAFVTLKEKTKKNAGAFGIRIASQLILCTEDCAARWTQVASVAAR